MTSLNRYFLFPFLIAIRMRSIAFSLFERFGFYRKYRFAPVDMRGLTSSPIDALKRSHGYPVIINVPFDKCRNMRPLGFKCMKNSGHPYIHTALSILDGSSTSYIGSPLQKYYEYFQPANLAELLGFNKDDICHASKLSPFAFVFPWDGTPSVRYERLCIRDITNENISHGYVVSASEGWPLIGPVSMKKGSIEFLRLSRTIDSINNKGYHRCDKPDGDVRGVALCRDNEYVVLLSPGNHRVAALVALGYCELPVRLGTKKVSIVCRDKVKSWPAVKNGFFTADQALKIFDRVFDGHQPFY